MPLETQLVDVNLGAGVRQEVDPNVATEGLYQVQDYYLDRDGALLKRPGYGPDVTADATKMYAGDTFTTLVGADGTVRVQSKDGVALPTPSQGVVRAPSPAPTLLCRGKYTAISRAENFTQSVPTDNFIYTLSAEVGLAGNYTIIVSVFDRRTGALLVRSGEIKSYTYPHLIPLADDCALVCLFDRAAPSTFRLTTLLATSFYGSYQLTFPYTMGVTVTGFSLSNAGGGGQYDLSPGPGKTFILSYTYSSLNNSAYDRVAVQLYAANTPSAGFPLLATNTITMGNDGIYFGAASGAVAGGKFKSTTSATSNYACVTKFGTSAVIARYSITGSGTGAGSITRLDTTPLTVMSLYDATAPLGFSGVSQLSIGVVSDATPTTQVVFSVACQGYGSPITGGPSLPVTRFAAVTANGLLPETGMTRVDYSCTFLASKGYPRSTGTSYVHHLDIPQMGTAGPISPGYASLLVDPYTYTSTTNSKDAPGGIAQPVAVHSIGRIPVRDNTATYVLPLPEVVQDDDGHWIYPVTQLYDPLTATYEFLIFRSGIQNPTAATIKESSKPYVQAQRTCYAALGTLTQFDGIGSYPAGFLHPPDILASVASTFAGTGTWGASTVSVRARYIWTDAMGNELTSQWSLPVNTAISANFLLQVSARPYYFHTLSNFNNLAYLNGSFAYPRIQFSVALGSSSTYYIFAAQNNTAAAQARMTDLPSIYYTAANGGRFEYASTYYINADSATLALADLVSVPADFPQPASYVSVGRGRMFLVSSEYPTSVFYSRTLSDRVLPIFSSAFQIQAPASIGALVACEEIEDKVVLFGRRGIAYFVGDGPDQIGSGGLYQGPYVANTEYGVASANSVIKTAYGVLFRSNNSITLVDRSMTPQVLGRAVQDVLDANPVTLCSGFDHARDLAWWLVRPADVSPYTGTIIQYSFNSRAFFTQDLTFYTTGRTILDAASCLRGMYVSDSVQSYKLGNGSGFDGAVGLNSAPRGKVTTPYLRLGKINGFQRARYISIFVKVHSAGSLRLSVDTDSAGTYAGSGIFAVSPGTQRLRYHIPPAMQKSAGLRIVLYDQSFDTAPPGSDNVRGFDILGITLEIGVKRGPRTVAAAGKFLCYSEVMASADDGLMGSQPTNSDTNGGIGSSIGRGFGFSGPNTIAQVKAPVLNKTDFNFGGSAQGYQTQLNGSDRRQEEINSRNAQLNTAPAQDAYAAAQGMQGNYGQVNNTYGQLSGMLMNQASGQGPSVAADQYTQQANDATKRAQAMAMSAGGGQGVLGARMAAEQQYQGGQDAARQAGMIRSQEMLQGREALGNMTGQQQQAFAQQQQAQQGLGTAQLGLSQAQVGTQLQQQGQNDAASQQERGRQMAMMQSQHQGLMGYQTGQAQATQNTQALNSQAAQFNAGQQDKQDSKAAGVVSSVAGKVTGMFGFLWVSCRIFSTQSKRRKRRSRR